MAVVVGTQVVMKPTGTRSVRGHQDIQHKLSFKNTRPPRKSTKSTGHRAKALSSPQIFDLLCAMAKVDMEHVVPEKETWFEQLKRRGDREISIKIMMSAMDFEQARQLFARFDGEGITPENIARYEPLVSFLAYRAVERMAVLDPTQTLELLMKNEEDKVRLRSDKALEAAVVLGWSESDPAAAAQWWRVSERGHSDSSYSFYSAVVDQEVFRRFAKVDYSAALKLASEAKERFYKVDLYTAVIEGMPKDVDLAQFATSDLPRMIEECEEMSTLNTLPEIEKLFRQSPADEMKKAMAIKWVVLDTDAALQWYEGKKHHTVAMGDLDQPKSMVRSWAGKDPASFIPWAKSQQGEAQALTYYFGHEAPQALTYISQMGEAENRVELAKASIAQGEKSGEFSLGYWLESVDEHSASTRYYQQQIDHVLLSPLQPDNKKELLRWLKEKKSETP